MLWITCYRASVKLAYAFGSLFCYLMTIWFVLALCFSSFNSTWIQNSNSIHPTSKGAPACAKASKSYDWDVRSIAKISPKIAIFRLFLFFQTLHRIQTKFSTVILHHIRYLAWIKTCRTKKHQQKTKLIGSTHYGKQLHRKIQNRFI